MIIAITKEMQEEWDKHPAKQYVGVPLGGVVESSMNRDDLIRLKIYREAVVTWSESEEARAAAYRIRMAEEEVEKERARFRQLLDNAVEKEREHFMRKRR